VAFDFHKPRIGAFGELSRRYGKVTCNVLISDWLQGPAALEAESDTHVAMFRSMDRCLATLAAWQRRHERRLVGPRMWCPQAPSGAAAKAAALLDSIAERVLTEREAKQVLAAYGVPVVTEKL